MSQTVARRSNVAVPPRPSWQNRPGVDVTGDDLLALLPPEKRARLKIDQMLRASGWIVQDAGKAHIAAGRGVAIREFILEPPHGRVDYLLYVDAKAAGTIEAKPEGYTLTSVEPQTAQYIGGMPASFPAWGNPLPFSYESTGSETRFTSWLDPDPRSRLVFSFHRPETIAGWLDDWQRSPEKATLRSRLQQMPPLEMGLLWPPKDIAITNLERSFAANRPRALIQMATGSGKTFWPRSLPTGSSSSPTPAGCSSSWTGRTSVGRPCGSSRASPPRTTGASSPSSTTSSASPRT